MLKTLKLANWRSHESIELAFGRGTNVIVGMMGAGKSSVLEGICFCLFGKLPSIEADRALEDVITSRPHQKQEACAELEFEADAKCYYAKREISRSKSANSSARDELREEGENGRLITKGRERVTTSIEKLLGIDYSLFTRAIFSEQNSIDYFLTLDAGRRKDEIDRLLYLHQFGNARKTLTTVIYKFEQEIGKRRAFMEGVKPEGLKQSLLEEQKAYEELKAKIHEGEKRLADYEKEMQTHEGAGKRAEEKRRKWFEFERKRATHEQTIKELERELSEHKAVDEKELTKLKTSLEKITAELEMLEKDGRELAQKKDEAIRRQGSLSEKLKELMTREQKNESISHKLAALTGGKTIDSLHSEYSEATAHFDALQKKLSAAEASLASLQSSKRELEKADASCPVCEAPLEGAKKRELGEKRAKGIAEIHALVSKLGEEAKHALQARDNLRHRTDEAGKLQAALMPLEKAELEKLKEELKATDMRLREIQAKAEELSKKRKSLDEHAASAKETLRIAEEAAQKAKRLQEVKAELLKVSEELSKLNFNEEEIEKALEALRKCEKGLAEAGASLRHWNDEQLPMHDRKIAELRLSVDAADKRTKEIEALEKKVESLSIFGNALVDVQEALRIKLIDEINSAMNSMWPKVYPYGDFDKIRLQPNEAGYDLELYDGSEWGRAERVASGGERACACLALRIAFAHVLVPKLHWLILDEPTHNLDTEAIGAFSLALRDEIPKIVDQVFVITHEEKLEGAAANGKLIYLPGSKRKVQ